jgi:microcystin-dependent protein
MTFAIKNPPSQLTWGETQTTIWDPPPKPCVQFTLVLLRAGRADLFLGATSDSSIAWDVPPIHAAACRLRLTAHTSEGDVFEAETDAAHAFAIGGASGPPGDPGPVGARGEPGLAGPGLPSGAIVAFGGTVGPEGWLLCDGSTVNRKTYAALFEAISDAWGAGDGSTTFVLPDLRGAFLRGADPHGIHDPDIGLRVSTSGVPAAGVGSRQTGATAMPAAAFAVGPVGDHTHGDPTTNGQAGPYELAFHDRGPSEHDYGAESAPTTAAGAHSHPLAGGDHETRPPNTAVTYLIKT